MQILDVIPLIPLPRHQAQIVSYFHSEAIERGKIVQVLFNNRKIKAVVVASAPLAERKLQFKKQVGFTLKKIQKILKGNISEEQIKKAEEISEYYFVSLGIALRTVMLHPDEENYKKYISPGPVLDLPPLTDKRGRGEIRIVDMRREIRDANYSIFSRALKEALQEFDKIIIFIPRKGYANFLLCKDCGHAIKCPNCSASLTLHDVLICHHCNYQETLPKSCPQCQSPNLKPYGIGIDKVEDELLKFFQYQNLAKPRIAKLTSETKKLPENFDILLATQAIFKYKNILKIKFLYIMNSDALVHVPDFRAEENLLKQTLLLASMANNTIIQTYNPDDPALVAAATGTVKEFWDRELALRKQYGYPPFTKLIKLTYRNRDRQTAQRVARSVAEKLKGTAYSALISRERGFYIWNVLLKNPSDATRYALHELPVDWHIDVDPLSIV